MNAETSRKTIVYTSFNFAYAARATLLAKSIRRHEENIRLVALLVDEVKTPSQKKNEATLRNFFDDVVLASELQIPNFEVWMFKHNVVEACTAVKPRFLEKYLSEGYKIVVYLDPDTYLYSPFISKLIGENHQSILLTPHQLVVSDTEQSILDNELSSLKHGVFNLGFLAVRNTAEGMRFARWWRSSVEKFCYEKVSDGIFTDQKWCDLVPCFFEDYCTLRDPGLNVASWNISHRRLVFDRDGRVLINGRYLKFFHFTKVTTVGEEMLRRYSGSQHIPVELMRHYQTLLEAESKNYIDSPWAYGFFDDKSPVLDQNRKLYRERKDLQTIFTSPYKTGTLSFKEYCERNSMPKGG